MTTFVFPTPHTVRHAVFNRDGVDGMGNDAETWADPVDVKVIAYRASSEETLNGHTSRVVADVDMAIPPALTVSVRDRFTLAPPFNDPNDPEDKPYEVIGIEDANHGFHGWQPGSVVKLKRVTG
ncbi:hypothetical protein [Mycolicibacterium conceptionense]|uniref:hypothetical protein n=1 Tax=Mycolicibacterium conceptionense TaxID=451644 RepID=UPI003204A4BF